MTDDDGGLTAAEAARRLACDGPNELPHPPRRTWAARVGTQLRDPLVLVLLVVAAVTIAIGDRTDTLVVLLVIVGNTTVGVVQEVRADRAVEALDRLRAADTRVRRDGRVVTVPAREVVVGDRLVVGAGDVLVADGEVRSAEGLLVDEAAVTGESAPVARPRGALVPSGAVVTRGRAELLVRAVAAASAMGRSADLLVHTRSRPTPLQQQMTGLGRRLAVAAVLAAAVVAALGLARGAPPVLVAITALSLVVAAIPESLPVVVTLGLALGARRMAARHAVVRGLPAVETLGAVTLLALDKTGTLTSGRPEVAEVLVVPGVDVARIALAAALATDAPDDDGPDDDGPDDDGPGDAPGPAGVDPTERALVRWARERGVDVAGARSRHVRVDAAPFDARRRTSTSRHRDPAGDGDLVVVLGAPESVLDPDRDAELRARCDEAAGRGLRMLVVASRRVPVDARLPGTDDVTPLGALALLDPPRAEAAPSLARCRAAGIRPVVLTGDHPATARAVAAAVALTGDRPPDTARADEPGAATADVVARCRPERKLDLVAAWQDQGQVVAMTGDGVNDGPALRRADIGVAMGRHGTEVARQAADLVLADDDLGTLVTAVEEGRRIDTNVRRFLAYALTGGLAEVLVMLLGPLVGVALPLLPAQILWINLLTHGLPGVAFGAEPAEPGLATAPPRRPGTWVFAGGLGAVIVVQGLVVTGVTLAALLLDDTGSRSATFLALGLAQLGVALGLRARRPRARRGAGRGTDWLLVAVAGAVLAQLAAVTLAPLQALLGTLPPSPTAWAVALGGAVVAGGAARVVGRPRIAPAPGPGTSTGSLDPGEQADVAGALRA